MLSSCGLVVCQRTRLWDQQHAKTSWDSQFGTFGEGACRESAVLQLAIPKPVVLAWWPKWVLTRQKWLLFNHTTSFPTKGLGSLFCDFTGPCLRMQVSNSELWSFAVTWQPFLRVRWKGIASFTRVARSDNHSSQFSVWCARIFRQ